jgi:spore coat polysaccharide biosynthesis protein SpsF (cytidylyltransferase family)
MNQDRIVAIVQARMGSSRLPGKVLADVGGQPLLQHVLDRARRIKGIDEVMVATTTRPEDQGLRRAVAGWGVRCLAGNAEDVLDRYAMASRQCDATVIVRITADCPLLDPVVAAQVVALRQRIGAEYASNVHPPTFPDGLDVEAFTVAALKRAWTLARRPSEREHVTSYLWTHPDQFSMANLTHTEDLSALRWTVDERADLELVRAIYARLPTARWAEAGLAEVLAAVRAEPPLGTMNAGIARNAGYARSLKRDAEWEAAHP